MPQCKDCNDTGRITLFSSTVDCDCTQKPTVESDLQHHTEESGLYNGWFSKLGAAKNGWAVYLNENGDKIAITEVSRTPIPISKWNDLEFVGVVKK